MNLTPAEAERLTLLIEECSEVTKIACKILRYGYDSFHPDHPTVPNRELLAIECGHISMAIDFMVARDDLNGAVITGSQQIKYDNVRRWLRYNVIPDRKGKA